jgi:serine phosphatase RsbU (regulator of sigma subunit)
VDSPAFPASALHPDRQQPYLRIHCAQVFVRDQERSLSFFCGQLGFSLITDYRFPDGRRWITVAPPDGTAILALVAPQPGTDEFNLIGRSARVVFVTEDVAGTYQEWHRRGVEFDHPPRPESWRGSFTSFRDLDGNAFALVTYDRVVRDLEEQRRAFAEKLEADRRAARELEIAREVQSRLFPQTQPPLRTLSYAGVCIQARQVGGDYYDYLDLGQRRLGLVIGDISGKGIAAALLMANLQANLRSQCAIAFDEPLRLLRSVNQLFYQNSPSSAYATLFFADYDDQSRRLRYANCGHLPALLRTTGGKLERLDSTGTVVGLFERWDCTIRECSLSPGDTLALYTDGVTESFNDAGEEFGEERLIAALEQHRDLPTEPMLAAVVNDVQRFGRPEQHDDITVMIAQCR